MQPWTCTTHERSPHDAASDQAGSRRRLWHTDGERNPGPAFLSLSMVRATVLAVEREADTARSSMWLCQANCQLVNVHGG